MSTLATSSVIFQSPSFRLVQVGHTTTACSQVSWSLHISERMDRDVRLFLGLSRLYYSVIMCSEDVEVAGMQRTLRATAHCIQFGKLTKLQNITVKLTWSAVHYTVGGWCRQHYTGTRIHGKYALSEIRQNIAIAQNSPWLTFWSTETSYSELVIHDWTCCVVREFITTVNSHFLPFPYSNSHFKSRFTPCPFPFPRENGYTEFPFPMHTSSAQWHNWRVSTGIMRGARPTLPQPLLRPCTGLLN